MRIGIDVSAIRHGLANGVAVYTANLAQALLGLADPPSLTAWYCARPSDAVDEVLDGLTSLGAQVERAPAPWRWSPDGAWWLPFRPPVAPVLSEVDVFHVGEFQLPAPPEPGAPAFVATVHDLTTVTHARHHTLLNRAVHRRRLAWIRRHATRVVAVSENTAADLRSEGQVEADRIDVVYEARGHDVEPSSDPAAVRRRYRVGPQYILNVGTLEPRKNLERLVRAFERLPTTIRDPELVLVGGEGWRSDRIRQAVVGSPARGRIHLLGRVPADDLAALYANASVFAYPSLYEGFGLPVLEAMAAGTAVLTSDVSSLPEVAGDAALLVDPHSVDAILDGLTRLLSHEALRARLEEAGPRRARKFSWERTARETLAAYRRAAQSSAGISSVGPTGAAASAPDSP